MNDDSATPNTPNNETAETASGGAAPSMSQEPTPTGFMSDESSESEATSPKEPSLAARPATTVEALDFAPASDVSSSQSATNTPTEAAPAPSLSAKGPEPSQAKRRGPLPLLIACVLGLLLLAGAVLASYHAGHSRGYTSGKNAESVAEAAAQLKVPADATMTAQCVAGEGTQYVKPSDIPMGPIYNVWKGKVTGIEYMLDQDAIVGSKTINLLLQNQKYNHLDVMYEPAGHAGFTTPHYHVVLSMIPYSQEQMITCGGASSSDSTMMQ